MLRICFSSSTMFGFNLFQFGFTKFCPLGFMLKKLGVPETTASCGN